MNGAGFMVVGHSVNAVLRRGSPWARRGMSIKQALGVILLFVIVVAGDVTWGQGLATARSKSFTLLPPTKAHPQGLIEVRYKSRLYRIPKEYAFVNSNGDPSYFIFHLSWPSLGAMNSLGSELPYGRFDLVQVIISTENHRRREVSDAELERIIVKRHQAPVKLNAFPDLQEYPSKGRSPHYRSVDNSVRWADGLPTYFYCGGGAISRGFDIQKAYPTTTCTIELSWKDGVLMNIQFSRRLMGHWKEIHDRVVAWFESYRVVCNDQKRRNTSESDVIHN